MEILELPPPQPPLSFATKFSLEFIWVFWISGVGVAITIIFSGSGVGTGSSSIIISKSSKRKFASLINSSGLKGKEVILCLPWIIR